MTDATITWVIMAVFLFYVIVGLGSWWAGREKPPLSGPALQADIDRKKAEHDRDLLKRQSNRLTAKREWRDTYLRIIAESDPTGPNPLTPHNPVAAIVQQATRGDYRVTVKNTDGSGLLFRIPDLYTAERFAARVAPTILFPDKEPNGLPEL